MVRTGKRKHGVIISWEERELGCRHFMQIQEARKRKKVKHSIKN